MAPDEKRKECGQHLIEKYLKPNVSKRVVFAACTSRAVGKLRAVITHLLLQGRMVRAEYKATPPPHKQPCCFSHCPKADGQLCALCVGFSFLAGPLGSAPYV